MKNDDSQLSIALIRSRASRPSHPWKGYRFPSMDYTHLQTERRSDDRAKHDDAPFDEANARTGVKSREYFVPLERQRRLPRHVVPLGPSHLRTFKARLPEHLVQNLGNIVQACDRHAASHGGWTTNLFSLTKQDIPMADVPECARLSHEITMAVTDTARDLFGAQVYMDRNQPHVLKYDGMHRTTPFHHDQCHVTINLMLSSRDSYTGGGTYLMDREHSLFVRLEKGEYLIHPGPLLHRGCEILDGTRYLMVFFVNFIHPPTY